MTTEELKNIYLVFWNPYVETPLTLSEVRERLVRNNLNPERAAEVAASTAMRRAADVVKSKAIEAKTFTCRESNLVRTQIDRIDEDNGRLRRAFMAQYELDANDYPRHIAGEELAEFVPAFDQAKSHYTGAGSVEGDSSDPRRGWFGGLLAAEVRGCLLRAGQARGGRFA